MNSDSLTCQICAEQYDEFEHEPNVIQGCGHCLCSKCIDTLLERNSKTFECPFCKKQIKMGKTKKEKHFIKNYALLQLLLEKNGFLTQGNTRVCIEHKCPIELVCIDCKCEVCYKCAFLNFHRGHNLELRDNFYEAIDDKVKDLHFWKKKALEHNRMIKHYGQIEEKNILYLADIISKQTFEKISVIANNFFIQSQQLGRSMFTKGGYGFEELLINDEMINDLEKRTHNWTFNRTLDSAIEISKFDIKRFKTSIEEHFNQNNTKKVLNNLQEKYFNKLFDDLRSAVNDITQLINQREATIPELLKFSRYTKKTKDFLIKYDHPKKSDLKLMTKTNFKEILETSKKLILDLTDTSLDNNLKKQFLYGLREPNQIRSVSVKCPGNYTTQNFWEIFQSLPRMFDLKILTLDLICCSNLGIDDMKNLGEGFKSMKLRKLLLSIMESDILDETTIDHLVGPLSSMNKMISLGLCFDHSQSLNDGAFSKITNSLSKLEHLNHLKLSFHSCPKITNSSVEGFSRVLKGLKHLNSIELNFGSTSINSKGASDIIEAICKLRELKEIDLDFSSCDIHEDLVKIFGLSISDFTLIEKFNFSVANGSEETRKSLDFLSNCLGKLPLLKPFRLDIDEGVIDHKIIELIPEDEKTVEIPKEAANEYEEEEEEVMPSESQSEIDSDEKNELNSSLANDNALFDMPGTLIVNSAEASRDPNNKEINKPKEGGGDSANSKNNISNNSNANANSNGNGNGKKEGDNGSKNKKKSKPSFEGIIVLE